MIEIDVVGACGTRVQSNGLADDKGDGLGLCLAYCLGGCGAALGFVKPLVCLCSAQHKHTYVVFAVMLCSGLKASGHAGLSPAYTT
jgi:hypothetical protein